MTRATQTSTAGMPLYWLSLTVKNMTAATMTALRRTVAVRESTA